MTSELPRDQAPAAFETLYIVGAGGSGREAAWLARSAWGERLELVFVVSDPRYLGPEGHVGGQRIRLLDEIVVDPRKRFVAAIGNPATRMDVVQACVRRGLAPVAVVHPLAHVAPGATIGAGTLVYPGAVVSVGVGIGAHSQVNLGCTLSHDVTLDDYATLSPGVHLAGHVHVGRATFLGIGASVVNGTASTPLRLGDGAVIAAGACVTGPVDAGAMVAGVPATRKR